MNRITETREAVIVDCQVLTALGDLEATWSGLLQGRTGLKPYTLKGLKDPYPTGLVDGIDAKNGSFAYLDALIKRCGSFKPLTHNTAHRTDLIVATTKGAADELLDSPKGPWLGQPWQIQDHIAKMHGIQGKTETVSAACSSGTVALIRAAQKINADTTDMVMVVGIDIISRFVTGGFASLKGLAPKTCRPFDSNREGLALGEGIGIIVVTSKSIARKNSWPTLGIIRAWGVHCDAKHITAPCRNASGLLQVLASTTRNNTLTVGGINAHGTGTVYNDAMELTAFQNFWNKNIPPLHSVKGAIGHCLGAAGVIETGIALCSLRDNVIPPTVGLQHHDAARCSISGNETQTLTHPSILCCNSGFGGINAGILLDCMDI